MPSSTLCCCCDSSWTLVSLIGSYVDIALAYLLLIGSTLVFFTSKFLALFNLALPCPCQNAGLFGVPCFQTRFGPVNDSIRTRFPFDVLLSEPVGVLTAGIEGDGAVVIGDRVGGPGMRRIRRRKRKGKPVSISPRALRLSWHGDAQSGNFGVEAKEVVDEVDGNQVENAVPITDDAPAASECYVVKDMASSIGNVNTSNDESEVIIKNLERELDEAHAAHAALYLELEKERSAAASAADEAMAMILRLQNEKATVEMESRQYQRMIEEKSAYDEEEMEILKDIILRREREKHVLEKELDSYRQNIPDPSFNLSDDPTEMLKTICESIGKKEKTSSKMKWRDDNIRLLFPELPDPMGEYTIEFQEKGMVTTENTELDGLQEHGLCEETSCLTGQGDEEREGEIKTAISLDELEGMGRGGDQGVSNFSQFETESIVLDVHVVDDKCNLVFEEDGKVSNISQDELSGTSNGQTLATSLDMLNGRQEIDTYSDNYLNLAPRRSSMSAADILDVHNGGQKTDTYSNNSANLASRRSSMSAVDSERLKLETEVDILRKMLKTIEQGRENLSISVEYKEKETFQLQLQEDIACPLQEIKKIIGPGKSMRHASLPPLSSKVSSKKRRCHSVAWGA